MKYSMIIVDDEKIIREGIKRFIEKKCDFFSVVRLFEDGKDAIEYLRENHVDLVLTDIRMPEVSGLELAQYIHQNAHNTETIILSGYKEFEYAQQAIENAVSYYLLKPVVNEEMLKTLDAIRHKLDEKNKNEKRLLQYDEFLEEIQSQFFVDLIFGGSKFSDDIEQMWEKLYLDFDAEDVYCAIIHINWPEDFIKNSLKYGQNGANTAINNFFTHSGNKCYNTFLGDGRYLILFDADELQDALQNLREWAREIFGVDILVEAEYLCRGILKLSEYCQFMMNQAAGIEKNTVITGRYMLLNTYINLKMYNEATELFCDLMHVGYGDQSAQGLKNQAIEILMFVAEDADKNGVIIDVSKYINLINEGQQSLKDIFEAVLADIEKVSCDDNILIRKIKNYVQENYAKDITLEMVGKNVNLNPVYMSRFFKEHTGVTFSDFLLSTRMTKSIQLLKSNKYKVYEIAGMVGYRSYKYFSKQFKAYTGYTPKSYCSAVWNSNI